MKIIFGHHLDSTTYLAELNGKNNAILGTIAVGPLRLLSILETTYGIMRNDKSEVYRLTAYETAIRQSLSKVDFYYKSFVIDPIGVSKRLLYLRDELFLSAPSNFEIGTLQRLSPRLKRFAKIEEAFLALQTNNEGYSGIPDRLRIIIRTIKENKIRHSIKSISYIEPLKTWPTLWNELYDYLKQSGSSLRSIEDESIHPAGGDLGQVQKTFLEGDKNQLVANNDGSIIHIRANSLNEAADITNAITKTISSTNETSGVVISQIEAETLDQASYRMNNPTLGSQIESSATPVLAILPLAFSLCLVPANPQDMLEFLQLEYNPLPLKLRKRLLKALSAKPATNSPLWNEVLENYFAGESKDTTERTNLEEKILPWLNLSQCKVGSVDSKVVLQICRMVSSWAKKRSMGGKDENIDLMTAAYGAKTLADIITLKEEETIDYLYLQRLNKEINSSRSALADGFKQELGSLTKVKHPSAILNQADYIIWWCALDSTTESPAWSFWRKKELVELEEVGIKLSPVKDKLIADAKTARRAICLAKKRVILVSVTSRGDEPEEPHPVWHEIRHAFKGGLTTYTPEMLTSNSNQILNDLFKEAVPQKIFPLKEVDFKATWQLTPDSVGTREFESASSLEKIVGCPLAWVLHYQANIKEPDSYAVPMDNLLYGNIAHDLIEQLLKSKCGPESAPFDANQVNDWMGSEFDNYVSINASTLLQPGNEGELYKVKEQIISGAKRLVELLNNGDYVCYDSEQKHVLENPYGSDGPSNIVGFPDLELHKRNDPEKKVAIDLKWGGKSYRSNILKRGWALQLAIYSQMLNDSKKSKMIPTGFFIIKDAELLTIHDDLFPGARVIKGIDENETWEVFSEEIEKAYENIKDGIVEIGVDSDKKKDLENTGRFIKASCGFCCFEPFCLKNKRG